jgi:hypothetical protein
MNYKHPTKTFVNLVSSKHEVARNEDKLHNASPRCLSLCNQATMNVQEKADLVTAKVMKTYPCLVFKTKDIVLVPLDDVDCTKVDSANLAGVVVLIIKANTTCWVAVKQGLLYRA